MTEISDTPEVDEDLLHLVVLSGLNNEAQNIIFGCAILKEINVEAVTWMLHHFRESNMKNGNQFEDSDVVISDYKDCISLAVEIVFSHNTTHLFCQKSIKAYIREQFDFLIAQLPKRISSPKDLLTLILDLVEEPYVDKFI